MLELLQMLLELKPNLIVLAVHQVITALTLPLLQKQLTVQPVPIALEVYLSVLELPLVQ